MIEEIYNIIAYEVKKVKDKIFRGYSDEEVWGTSYSLAKIVLPRLKWFKESKRTGYPDGENEKDWEKKLNKMIKAFELYIADEEGKLNCRNRKNYKKQNEQIQEGLELFGKHFRSLWD